MPFDPRLCCLGPPVPIAHNGEPSRYVLPVWGLVGRHRPTAIATRFCRCATFRLWVYSMHAPTHTSWRRRGTFRCSWTARASRRAGASSTRRGCTRGSAGTGCTRFVGGLWVSRRLRPRGDVASAGRSVQARRGAVAEGDAGIGALRQPSAGALTGIWRQRVHMHGRPRSGKVLTPYERDIVTWP